MSVLEMLRGLFYFFSKDEEFKEYFLQYNIELLSYLMSLNKVMHVESSAMSNRCYMLQNIQFDIMQIQLTIKGF